MSKLALILEFLVRELTSPRSAHAEVFYQSTVEANKLANNKSQNFRVQIRYKHLEKPLGLQSVICLCQVKEFL